MSALRTLVIVAVAAALGYWHFAAAYLVGVVAGRRLWNAGIQYDLDGTAVNSLPGAVRIKHPLGDRLRLWGVAALICVALFAIIEVWHLGGVVTMPGLSLESQLADGAMADTRLPRLDDGAIRDFRAAITEFNKIYFTVTDPKVLMSDPTLNAADVRAY